VPRLTEKREAFAAAMAKGLSQAAAYREAFPKSLMWAGNAVHVNASKLAANTQVRLRVDELRIKAGKESEVTMAEHVRTLQKLRDSALASGQYAAAIKAEELRGRCAGLYIEKHQHAGQNGGPLRAVAMTLEEFRCAAVDIAAKV
jgi:hypothetical protein